VTAAVTVGVTAGVTPAVATGVSGAVTTGVTTAVTAGVTAPLTQRRDHWSVTTAFLPEKITRKLRSHSTGHMQGQVLWSHPHILRQHVVAGCGLGMCPQGALWGVTAGAAGCGHWGGHGLWLLG